MLKYNGAQFSQMEEKTHNEMEVGQEEDKEEKEIKEESF